MKAIFNVAIRSPQGGTKFARKEKEIDFVPVAGMQVDDSVWKYPVKIVSVCYGIESEDLYITLEKCDTEDLKDQQSTLKMYRDHGWATSQE